MHVHGGLLGHPNYSELPDFQVFKEEDRVYTGDVPIFQPIAHLGADHEEGTTYAYVKEMFRPLAARLSKGDQASKPISLFR